MTNNNPEEVRRLTLKIEQTFSLKIRERMRKKRIQLAPYLPKMTSIACTIASEPHSIAVLGGYFLQINLGSSKSLKATAEGFCLDERASHPLSPVFFTLSHLYSLHLTHLPLTLHFTSANALNYLQTLSTKEDPISQAVALLLSHFPEVTFAPCFQGFFFERMHSRLRQLRCEEINEVVPLDFKMLSERLLVD